MLSSSSPPIKKPSPRKSKTFLLKLFLWIKKFLGDHKLPYVANQACRVYFHKEKSSRKQCQSLLQTRIELDEQQLQRFLHTSIGDRLLSWLSPIFHFPDHPDPKHRLRQLMLEMANKPEGLSLIHLLQLVPEEAKVNIDHLLAAAQKIEALVKQTEFYIEIVKELATAKLNPEQIKQFEQWVDLRQQGTFGVKQCLWQLEGDPPLQVLCHQPEPLPDGQIPVVIQSHGLGASPEDFVNFAEHLASYGYFVAAPYHHGSDTNRLRLMLQGESTEVFPFSEFYDRPLAIQQVLDALERENREKFAHRLILDRVGVMGHSFGAYTAFALAGAQIQFDHLELACDIDPTHPNLSLLLQCQALELPRQFYHLGDRRVACLFTWDFVGSEIFGEVGLKSVEIPVMAIAGSQDITAPFALEQIRLFQWLQSQAVYLILMQGKPHVQNLRKLARSVGLQIDVSPAWNKPEVVNPIYSDNIQALSTAFFDVYLQGKESRQAYLSANYGQYLSQPPINIFALDQADKLNLQQRLSSTGFAPNSDLDRSKQG